MSVLFSMCFLFLFWCLLFCDDVILCLFDVLFICRCHCGTLGGSKGTSGDSKSVLFWILLGGGVLFSKPKTVLLLRMTSGIFCRSVDPVPLD